MRRRRKGSKQEATEITEEDDGSSQNTGNGISQKLTKITKIINQGMRDET